MGRRSIRIAAALGACAFSTAASVVGGACTLNSSTSAPPAPGVQNGPYVLNGSNIQPPPLTITDSTGRRLRVIADTITFSPSTMTYHGSGVAAVTPVGGTEQPPATITVAEQQYTLVGATITLPATIAGPVSGSLQGNSGFQLHMPDGTFWIYTFR